jgi:hypothetical protein
MTAAVAFAPSWCKLSHDFGDDWKWQKVAQLTGASVGVVMAIFAKLLIYASKAPVRGSVAGADVADMAMFLCEPAELVQAVIEKFEDCSLIADGWLTKWRSRQGDGVPSRNPRPAMPLQRPRGANAVTGSQHDIPAARGKGSTSTARVHKHRERKRAEAAQFNLALEVPASPCSRVAEECHDSASAGSAPRVAGECHDTGNFSNDPVCPRVAGECHDSCSETPRETGETPVSGGVSVSLPPAPPSRDIIKKPPLGAPPASGGGDHDAGEVEKSRIASTRSSSAPGIDAGAAPPPSLPAIPSATLQREPEILYPINGGHHDRRRRRTRRALEPIDFDAERQAAREARTWHDIAFILQHANMGAGLDIGGTRPGTAGGD